MSLTSIQDQGYTPPDFMEKRASTTSSENHFRPLSTISNLPSTNYFSSTPVIPISESKYSPSKLHRAQSLNEQERISTKKFKIFYSTILEGFYPQIQSIEIWQRFEKSLNNPFEYDRFIQELRQIKQAEKKQKCKEDIVLTDLNLQKLPAKSHSNEKCVRKSTRNQRSVRKIVIEPQEQSKKMKNSIKYIRSIMKHGQKYIRAG